MIVSAAMIFVGSVLLLLGFVKTIWEVYSWGKLAEIGERPALVGTDPRVRVRLFVIIAALGLTTLLVGCLSWPTR